MYTVTDHIKPPTHTYTHTHQKDTKLISKMLHAHVLINIK